MRPALDPWRCVFLPFAVGYFFSYLLRNVNAVIAPDLTRELAVSAADLGLLTSAYLFAFGAFQLPLGLLLDRYGPRRVAVDALGNPIIDGTGISTAILAQRYKAGDSIDELADDFGLSRDAVEQAIRYEVIPLPRAA